MLDNLSGTNENTADDSIGATEAQEMSETENEATLQDNAETSEVDNQDNHEEEAYYDIDGEEVSSSQIKEWKSGHLMQSDYTKKTQALSEKSKTVADKENYLSDKIESFESMENDVRSLLFSHLDGVDMDELRVNDMSEYMRIKDEKEKLENKLSEIVSKRNDAKKDLIDRSAAQLNESLGWQDEEKYNSDTKLMNSYIKNSGITLEEMKGVTSPKIMEAILNAARYLELQQNKANIQKKVVTPPKSVRGHKSTEPKEPKSLAERIYG